MKLHYYKADPNFGDQLNAWLWERLLPGRWTDDGPLFSAIGTLLGRSLPRSDHTIVFSSGVGYGALPDMKPSHMDVVCVRGPFTARVLGLPPEAAVTDGAALLATLEECRPVPSSRRHGVVFIPHHLAEDIGHYQDVCDRVGIEYLSPRIDSREVIDRLRFAKLVLADSMHAAIVADTLRVPWIPTASSDQINTFKWLDWASSMEIPYDPSPLGPSSVAGAVRNAALPWIGEKYQLNGRDTMDVLRHFRRQNSLYRSPGKRWAQRKIGHALKRVLNMVSRPRFSSWRAQIDQRLISGAALRLAAAARRTPFLSAEKVFYARVSELSRRLETVSKGRTLYANPLAAQGSEGKYE